MKKIVRKRIDEIVALHNEIGGYFKMSMERGIRIGGLLTEQKKSLQHGEYIPWIEANLPFTKMTATKYMKLYRNRKLLKSKSGLLLTEAYKLLEAPKAQEKSQEKFQEIAVADIEYNPFFDIRNIESSQVAGVIERYTYQEPAYIAWRVAQLHFSEDTPQDLINKCFWHGMLDDTPQQRVIRPIAVRLHNGVFQNLTDHYRLAAIRAIPSIKKIPCVLVDSTDKQMKEEAKFEPTEPASTYSDFCKYLKEENERRENC